MERYSFPILTVAEIHNQLKNSLGLLQCTEEDITRPKFDTIKVIYMELLCLIHQKPYEELAKPNAQELEMLRYLDTQETSIPTIKLLKELCRIFVSIGCLEDPFKLSDILNPDFKRTRRFLSGLINFLRFMTEEQEVLIDKNEEFVRGRLSADELKKLKEEKDRLSAEVQGLTKFQVENQAAIKQKNDQIHELEMEKSKVSEERKKIEEKMQLLIVELENTEKSINSLQRCLEDASRSTRELEQSVVEDPEKIKNSLHEKKQKYKEMCALKENEKNFIEEVKLKTAKMEDLVSKVREAAIMLETIELSNAKYKELCRTLEAHRQESYMLEKKFTEKNLELEAIENDNNREAVKIETDKKSAESKLFSIETSLVAKRNEFEYVLKQKQDLTLEYNEKKKSCEAIEEQFKIMEEKHMTSMRQLKEDHDKILEKAQIYSRKIIEFIRKSDHANNP